MQRPATMAPHSSPPGRRERVARSSRVRAVRGGASRLLLLCLLLMLEQACSSSAAKYIDAAVEDFRAKCAAGQFHQIYLETAPDFKAKSSEPEFTAMLKRNQEAYGTPRAATRIGFQRGWYSDVGSVIVTGYQTKFDRIMMSEEFTWRIGDERAIMVGYHVTITAVQP